MPASTLISARSVFASMPMSVAGSSAAVVERTVILSAPPATWSLVTMQAARRSMMKPEPSPCTRWRVLRCSGPALALALLAEEALEEAAHLRIHHRAPGPPGPSASRSTRTLTTAGLTACHEVGIARVRALWRRRCRHWPPRASRAQRGALPPARRPRMATVAKKGAGGDLGVDRERFVGIGNSVCVWYAADTSGVPLVAGAYRLPKWPGSSGVMTTTSSGPTVSLPDEIDRDRPSPGGAGGMAAADDAVARLERRSPRPPRPRELLCVPQRLLRRTPRLRPSEAPPLRAIAAAAARSQAASPSRVAYLEQCTGRTHEAAQAHRPERPCALANYRQTHLVPEATRRGLRRANGLTKSNWHRRLGLLLGEDMRAPEPARALALAGAAMLALPADFGAERAALMPSLPAGAARLRERLRDRLSPTAPPSPRA